MTGNIWQQQGNPWAPTSGQGDPMALWKMLLELNAGAQPGGGPKRFDAPPPAPVAPQVAPRVTLPMPALPTSMAPSVPESGTPSPPMRPPVGMPQVPGGAAGALGLPRSAPAAPSAVSSSPAASWWTKLLEDFKTPFDDPAWNNNPGAPSAANYPPPEKPEPPTAAPAQSAPAPASNGMPEIWKKLLEGGGGGESIRLPAIPGRRDYPSAPPPAMAAPTKPDYTEADKYFEASKPTGRKGVDQNLAVLMGMMAGFDPRPGESFGMTLGRMAGPGAKAYLSADEKNKDIEAENKANEARWNAMRGQSLSSRADTAAVLGTEASKTDFANRLAVWKNELDKTKFNVEQDNTQFSRGVDTARLGLEGRRTNAAERTAQASILRAFGATMDSSNRTPVYDLMDATAKMARNQLGLPPGIDQGAIDKAVNDRLAAETKTNSALIMNSQMGVQRRIELRQEEIGKAIMGLPPAARDALLQAMHLGKRKEQPAYLKAFGDE